MKRRNWTEHEKKLIHELYATTANEELVKHLDNRSIGTLQAYALANNLKKECKAKIGDRFGKLVVAARTKDKNKTVTWLCRCDCGNTMTAETNTLTSGHSTSCGCGRLEAISTGYKHITGTWYGQAKRNAKSRGREFNLTHKFLNELLEKQNHKCAISGLDIKISKRRSGKLYYQETTASLDRIDNEKGYTEDNVQFVHKHINYMKSTHDLSYFITICRMVANNDNSNADATAQS